MFQTCYRVAAQSHVYSATALDASERGRSTSASEQPQCVRKPHLHDLILLSVVAADLTHDIDTPPQNLVSNMLPCILLSATNRLGMPAVLAPPPKYSITISSRLLYHSPECDPESHTRSELSLVSLKRRPSSPDVSASANMAPSYFPLPMYRRSFRCTALLCGYELIERSQIGDLADVVWVMCASVVAGSAVAHPI